MSERDHLKPITPIVNISGTDGKMLLLEYLTMMEAVRDAAFTIMKSPPNPRDYEVFNPDLFLRALAEHKERVSGLIKLYQTYEVIAESIQEQIEGQEA